MSCKGIFLVTAWLLSGSSGSADEANRLATFGTADSSVQQWKLPGKLREISGLALTPDERLFAVADESAVIFEIDYANGALIKAFAFGDPVVRGDFEGIAWLEGRLYLTTSAGILYSAAEGDAGEHVAPTRIDTGLGEFCEIEGLADDASNGNLFFACKTRIGGSKYQGLHIFEWSPSQNEVVGEIQMPLADILRTLNEKEFSPSGLVLDRSGGNFLVVAAKQRSLAEITADGDLVAARRFQQPGRHRQAEGIELTSGGKLLIADEGGNKKARLAVYAPRAGGGFE